MGKVSRTLIAGACVVIIAVVWYSVAERQSQLAAQRQAELEALADTFEAKSLAKEEKEAFNKQRAATLTPELCGQIALVTITRESGNPPLTREHEDDLRLCDDLGRLGEHDRDRLSLSGAL